MQDTQHSLTAQNMLINMCDTNSLTIFICSNSGIFHHKENYRWWQMLFSAMTATLWCQGNMDNHRNSHQTGSRCKLWQAMVKRTLHYFIEWKGWKIISLNDIGEPMQSIAMTKRVALTSWSVSKNVLGFRNRFDREKLFWIHTP